MARYMANVITGSRIFFSVLLLFFPVYSIQFYIAYLLCGVSDMIDGAVARRTNSANEFGAKLDTVADVVFVAVAMSKWLPKLSVPGWLWGWIAVIAVMKAFTLTAGFICKKKLIAYHSVLNKATGVLLFLLPLTLSSIALKYSAVMVCAVATVAAIQEGCKELFNA